jgi:hypothetical protein
MVIFSRVPSNATPLRGCNWLVSSGTPLSVTLVTRNVSGTWLGGRKPMRY